MKWEAHAPSRVGFDALVETTSTRSIRSAKALTDAREARALPAAEKVVLLGVFVLGKSGVNPCLLPL
jgi:hypothetical protein